METLFIGQNQYFLPEIESTNTYAMGLLRNVNVPDGSIVFTDHQTKGKGQRGHTWNAEISSNITVSIILKPGFLSLKKAFYLSKISALAIYDVLAVLIEKSHFDIKIKWPNDILLNGRKIAGILIENNISQQHLSSVVVGIGININQEYFPGLESTATSLKKEYQQEFNRVSILNSLCSFMEKWYFLLKQEKYEQIDQAYFMHLLGYQSQMRFESLEGGQFNAFLNGVTESGLLELIHGNGELKHYDIKEIKTVL